MFSCTFFFFFNKDLKGYVSVATVFCALLTECSRQLLICNDSLASHKASRKSPPRAASAQLPSKLQCRLNSGSLLLSSSFQIASSVLMWETPHGTSSSLRSASHYLILPFVFFFKIISVLSVQVEWC